MNDVLLARFNRRCLLAGLRSFEVGDVCTVGPFSAVGLCGLPADFITMFEGPAVAVEAADPERFTPLTRAQVLRKYGWKEENGEVVRAKKHAHRGQDQSLEKLAHDLQITKTAAWFAGRTPAAAAADELVERENAKIAKKLAAAQAAERLLRERYLQGKAARLVELQAAARNAADELQRATANVDKPTRLELTEKIARLEAELAGTVVSEQRALALREELKTSHAEIAEMDAGQALADARAALEKVFEIVNYAHRAEEYRSAVVTDQVRHLVADAQAAFAGSDAEAIADAAARLKTAALACLGKTG